MRVTVILFVFLSVVSALPQPQPQNLLSEIRSVFGFGDDDSKTTSSTFRSLLATPASTTSASTRSTLSVPKTTSTKDSSSSASASKTKSSQSTNVTSSAQTTSTSSDSSTITSAPTTTSTPSPSTTIPAPAITSNSNASTQPSGSNNTVPPGGIAIAVIMSLAVVLAAAWLLFRYHPGIRRRWLAHQEKKMQERSYRDAIDGPFARSGGSGVRGQALGSTSSRKSTLASFFAPRTANLGHGKEIRRKPVNWGAPAESTPPVPELPGSGMEKVALTNMAAPMARSESLVSSTSYQHSHSGRLGSAVSSPTTVGGGTIIGNSTFSSPAVGHKELPATPVSASASVYRPMPPIPPVPPTPQEPKRDMHRILSRKSIFELA